MGCEEAYRRRYRDFSRAVRQRTQSHSAVLRSPQAGHTRARRLETIDRGASRSVIVENVLNYEEPTDTTITPAGLFAAGTGQPQNTRPAGGSRYRPVRAAVYEAVAVPGAHHYA